MKITLVCCYNDAKRTAYVTDNFEAFIDLEAIKTEFPHKYVSKIGDLLDAYIKEERDIVISGKLGNPMVRHDLLKLVPKIYERECVYIPDEAEERFNKPSRKDPQYNLIIVVPEVKNDGESENNT